MDLCWLVSSKLKILMLFPPLNKHVNRRSHPSAQYIGDPSVSQHIFAVQHFRQLCLYVQWLCMSLALPACYLLSNTFVNQTIYACVQCRFICLLFQHYQRVT